MQIKIIEIDDALYSVVYDSQEHVESYGDDADGNRGMIEYEVEFKLKSINGQPPYLFNRQTISDIKDELGRIYES